MGIVGTTEATSRRSVLITSKQKWDGQKKYSVQSAQTFIQDYENKVFPIKVTVYLQWQACRRKGRWVLLNQPWSLLHDEPGRKNVWNAHTHQDNVLEMLLKIITSLWFISVFVSLRNIDNSWALIMNLTSFPVLFLLIPAVSRKQFDATFTEFIEGL